MAYKGKYTPKNPKKYKGDPTKVTWRSSWELQALKWLDNNPDIKWFSSEELVIPYRCKTDNKVHRYFPDLIFENLQGQKFIIEIKPKKETQPPKKPKRKSKKFLTEVTTYAKNISKWEAAKIYAENNGFIFDIWTEDELKKLGMRLVTSKPKSKRYRNQPRKGSLKKS